MIQVTVEVDVGLNQDDTEEFLAYLIEVGMLNHEQQRMIDKYENLRRGEIAVNRKNP